MRKTLSSRKSPSGRVTKTLLKGAKKIVTRICIMILLLFGLIALALLGRVWLMISESVAVWEELRDAVARGNWSRVRAVRDDGDGGLHELRQDGIHYMGEQFNSRIAKARPDFRRTFQYYLLNYRRQGKRKVVISGGGGYALIEKGRITFIKFPQMRAL